MAAQQFDCVVDEISMSLDLNDLLEVRGSPRIEEHFTKLEAHLRYFGFDTRTDMESLLWAMDTTASGRDLRPLESPAAVPDGRRPPSRWRT